MLEYDRIDNSEGIDINKKRASKEYDICHYWYFLSKNFNYWPYLCNGCHDLMQKAISFNDVANVSVKGSDYRTHFWHMGKNDAISIMNNSNLNDKRGVLYFYIIITYKNQWENLFSKKQRRDTKYSKRLLWEW